VSYLARVARRAAATPAPVTSRPAMPSRSPLVEADQRLNLDFFASRFDSSVGPPPQQRFEDDPLALNEFEPVVGHTPSEPASAHPGAPAMEIGTHPQRPEHEPNAVSPPVLPQRGTPGGASPPLLASRKRIATSESTEPRPRSVAPPAQPDVRPATTPGTTPRTERAIRREEQPDAQTVAQERIMNAGRGRERTPLGGSREQPTAGALMDALHRALAWVGDKPARSSESGPGEQPPAQGQPHLRERRPVQDARKTPQPGLRTGARETRPVTHLEIGKIEVEIMPPVPAPRTAAPASPRAPGFTGFSTQRFGWRQR
jgi:hypothetical protein